LEETGSFTEEKRFLKIKIVCRQKTFHIDNFFLIGFQEFEKSIFIKNFTWILRKFDIRTDMFFNNQNII
jgi:hypothetical protein